MWRALLHLLRLTPAMVSVPAPVEASGVERINLGQCDRCPARAVALWQDQCDPLLLLVLCGHHSGDHTQALRAQHWTRMLVTPLSQ